LHDAPGATETSRAATRYTTEQNNHPFSGNLMMLKRVFMRRSRAVLANKRCNSKYKD
jgi:hypothetical protein